MTECGCLDDAKKKVLTDILDVHKSVIEDPLMKATIDVIKKDIQKCKCRAPRVKEEPMEEKPKVNKKAESKEKEFKSERGSFMSNCMKKEENGGQGLSMSECSVLWKEQKG